MHNNFWLLISLCLVLFISGCSSTKELQQMSPEIAKEFADQYFAAQKYKKAIPYYQKIVHESNSVLLADAQLRLADCFFFRQEYIDARFEYEEFIRQFSEHSQVPYAFFQIGVCWFESSLPAHYDQSETFSAIDAFTEYLDRYPFHDKVFEAHQFIEECRFKLLKKRYYNGYTYYKMADYPSALLYFKEIIEKNQMHEFDRKALYYSALMYHYRNDLKNMQLMLARLQEKYPDSSETKTILNKKEKLAREIDK
jgi:outer membrane protein assembly factor BamD